MIVLLQLALASLLLNYVAIQVDAIAKKDFSGIIVPVFTPYCNNTPYVLNLDVIPDYAEYLSKNGVSGVIVAGTEGEASSLNLWERKALFEAWVKAAQPLGLAVIAHVATMPTLDIYSLLRFCEVIGVDAVILLPPLYFKPLNVREEVMNLQIISAKGPSLPIFYYHNPVMSCVYLNIVKFFILATALVPNFIGVRCPLEEAVQITATSRLKSNQYLMISNHYSIQPAFVLGFNSSVAAASGIFPKLAVSIMNGVNSKRGIEDQDKINNFMRAVIVDPLQPIPSAKAAFSIVSGIPVGITRPPLYGITFELLRNITTRLEQAGVKLTSPVR